jgi:hypothetical protein
MRRKEFPIESIFIGEVEVYSKNGIILIGTGLVYFNSNGMMKPDMVDLVGEPLPPGWFTLKPVSEPKLAVRAKSVQ